VKCKLCYGEITAPKAERQLQRKARAQRKKMIKEENERQKKGQQKLAKDG